MFDLFHTLVDTEHLRPRGFRDVTAVAEVCEVDLDRFGAFWSATYVDCNVFDRGNGLVEPQEQLRRARQADTTVDTVDELEDALALR